MTSDKNPSRWRQISRWLPITLLIIAILGAWVLFLQGGLVSVMAWYLVVQLILPLLGFVLVVVVLVHWLRKRYLSAPMLATLIGSLVAIVPLLWLLGIWQIAYPVSLENSYPAATVRLPANEPLLVAWGGDSVETNYHAITPDQRWAYDFVVAPYLTGSKQVQDYGCWGMDVVAPANGRVVIAHDGEPDQIPGQLQTSEQPFGNHVVIELPTETYLVLAHLKPNSVIPSEGDMVTEGQIVGQCGNSGNTSEPHIHIHHQRQSPADFPINFAEGLPLYFRDHDGQAMPQGGLKQDGDDIISTGDIIQHQATP